MKNRANRYTCFFVGIVVSLSLILGTSQGVLADSGDCSMGQGSPCEMSTDCQYNPKATVCVDGRCEVPCEKSEHGGFEKDPLQCSLGETCVQGFGDSRTVHYCEPGRFSMDLNLLDSCIMHFLEGIVPDLSSTDECSLRNNISQMLDQYRANNSFGRGKFNIYDVDACIREFLDQEPCDTTEKTCPDGDVYCSQDVHCGEGLFCNTSLNRCERECGIIVDRSETNTIGSLERQCSGGMKVCNYYRGQCQEVDIEDATCQVDRDCPNGAYCFLGACHNKCYRNIDCPDSNWYCGKTNVCLPKPKEGSSTGEAFDPKDYSIQFAEKAFQLDMLNDAYKVPLVMMNLDTKKQVYNEPNVVFGYRLEVKYGRKQEQKCYTDMSAWTDDLKVDCLIDEANGEAFVTLKNPFGTIYGSGDPTIDVMLNKGAVEKLTPGQYEATITAIFNNGNTSTTKVGFQKPSLNGHYLGQVSVYADGPQNHLGSTPLEMKLYIDEGKRVEWDKLLEENFLDTKKLYEDITEGYRVTGYIYGNSSMIFNNPKSRNPGDNFIPVKGIYAEQLGRIRLIGVMDLDSDYCMGEDGPCRVNDGEQLRVRNKFGRRLRRVVYFVGPYDPVARMYHGMYRESISGMAPADGTITLDGGFRLKQTVQDDKPIVLTEPLVAAGQRQGVGFPALSTMMETLEEDIAENCVGDFSNGQEAVAYFETRAAFKDFLNNKADIFGRVLADLVTLETELKTAVDALDGNPEAYLTLNDYLKGKIEFCEEEYSYGMDGAVNPVTPSENCINRRDIKCGLALYKKAILKGWVDTRTVGADGDYTLFCANSNDDTSDCRTPAKENKALYALHEHNRFYKEYTQTLTYEAANDLSDAFYTMYKAANGDELDADSAYKFKEAKLRAALDKYDEVLGHILAPETTELLYRWPMSAFAGRGSTWVGQLHNVISDRMESLTTLADLKRRILQNADKKDYVFVQHVLYQEYLHQVYLMDLQRTWQGERFAYAGQGPDVIEKGDFLLSKVNQTRNPLGLHPNRVYFENSNISLNNWQNYKQRIDTRLPQLKEKAAAALQNLKAALADSDNLKNGLRFVQKDFERNIDELCGEDLPLPDYCTVPREQKELMRSCRGEDCPFEYDCAEGKYDECDYIVSRFNEGTKASSTVACNANENADDYRILIGGQERTCARGRMGALLQEKVSLDLQRKQIFERIELLMRQIARQRQYMKDVQREDAEYIDYIKEQGDKLDKLSSLTHAAELVYTSTVEGANIMDCWVIGGLAAGTNCIMKAVAGGIKVTAAGVRSAVMEKLDEKKASIQELKEIENRSVETRKQMLQLRLTLDNMVTEVENYINEYEMVTQQLFNLDIQIDDVLYTAKQNIRRWEKEIKSIVNMLIGRETGDVLNRNKMIKEAEESFQAMLIEIYKMSAAFVHRYNLADVKERIMQRVYKVTTIDDIEDLVDELVHLEENYCGAEGLDCDYKNNQKIFEFSVREQLFPDLKEIVDAKTGKILTVGEQFHNIITSSEYIRKRKRSSGIRAQIEIPFAIWLNDRGSAGKSPKRYMVNPEECNHIVVGERHAGTPGGTVAVQVKITRPKDEITYELWRGNTDYLRSCNEQVSEYEKKVNVHIVGWAPQNDYGKIDNPPSFFTHSDGFQACNNSLMLSDPQKRNDAENCFYYFGRDRSLGAPDWKLVIPFVDEEQKWILGVGEALHARPVIEDIILYFRYNARPIVTP